MNRSLLLVCVLGVALAGCAGQAPYADGPSDPPLAGDLVQDAAAAIRIAQDACLSRFADPAGTRSYWAKDPPQWHARLHRGYWAVWVPEPLAPDRVDMKVQVRAKNGGASFCEMWTIVA